MMSRDENQEKRQRFRQMHADGMSISTIAKELGMHRGSISRWVKEGVANAAQADPKDGDAQVQFNNDNEAVAYCTDASRLSELIDGAGINLDVWQIDRVVVNKWDVTMKLGRDVDATIETRSNWQVKAFLSRKVPKVMEDAAEKFAQRALKTAPAYPRLIRRKRKNKRKKLLEIAPMDAHFGKLALDHVNGGVDDYDTDLAERIYVRAIEETIARLDPDDIESILLVFGNDFMHVNSYRMETGHGTRIEGDPFFSRVWDTGAAAVIKAIELLAGIAPVHVLFVPGNHGPDASRAVARYAEAWFRNADHVTFDIGQDITRKYIQHGNVMLGFTHGDEEKHATLPLIMANEAAEMWGKTIYREMHVGHFHRAKQTNFLSLDSHTGVAVRILPALCATDPWHYRKGFIGNPRAMEVFLWDSELGLDMNLTIPVKGLL